MTQINPPASSRTRSLVSAIIVAGGIFAALFPTLSWQEFSGSMENLVVATALETRRDNNWLVPNLEGEPRWAKPPLATWASAAAIGDATLKRLDATDVNIRALAYDTLASEVRWPGLAASCLTVIVTFLLGRAIAGDRVGLLGAILFASTLYFAYHGARSTTDVHLMLWVNVTLLMVTLCITRTTTWPVALAAAVPMALALMAKGPVALLQVVLPAVAYIVIDHFRCRDCDREERREFPVLQTDAGAEDTLPSNLAGNVVSTAGQIESHAPAAHAIHSTASATGETFDYQPNTARLAPAAASAVEPPPKRRALPLLIGLLLAIGLGSIWYVIVLQRVPKVGEGWTREITRSDNDDKKSSLFAYLAMLPFMLPWTVAFVHGFVWSVAETIKRPKDFTPAARRFLLPVLVIVLPICVMQFFPDRKERYLLPIVPSMAILAARSVAESFAGRTFSIRWHAIILFVFALATSFFFAGGYAVTRANVPWLSGPHAMITATLLGGVAAIAFVLANRGVLVVPLAGLVIGLSLFYIGFNGYTQSANGISDLRSLADTLRLRFPNAEMYNYRPDKIRQRASVDLAIYMNRPTVYTEDPRNIAPSNRPQVYILKSRKNVARPPELPGWAFQARVLRDDTYYNAYARGPKGATTLPATR